MRRMLVLCMVVVFSAVSVFAEEETEKKVSLWEIIRIKIEKVTPQKKPAVTTAVGGVRGSKAGTGKELYWKGADSEPVVQAVELDSFKGALAEAESGNLVQARLLFEKFVTDFPKSSLKDDAFSALHELGEATAQTAQTAQPAEKPAVE